MVRLTELIQLFLKRKVQALLVTLLNLVNKI